MDWKKIIERNVGKIKDIYYLALSLTEEGYENEFRELSKEIGAKPWYVDKSKEIVEKRREDLGDSLIHANIFDLKYNSTSLIFMPQGTNWSSRNMPEDKLADVANRFSSSGVGSILFYDIHTDLKRCDASIDYIFSKLSKDFDIIPIQDKYTTHFLINLK